MNANYAEICRIDKLKANFHQVPLFYLFIYLFIFQKFSQYCCETSIIQIQQRKLKNIFLDKNLKKKKSLYYRNCIGQTRFWL